MTWVTLFFFLTVLPHNRSYIIVLNCVLLLLAKIKYGNLQKEADNAQILLNEIV